MQSKITGLPDLSRTLELAVRHHQNKDFKQAEKLYQSILTKDPNNADVNRLMGILAHQAGKHEAAIGYFQRAIKTLPRFAEAYNSQGVSLKALNRLDEAISNFHKAINIKPDYAEAYYNLGNTYKASGNTPKGIESYQKAIAIRPDYSLAHNNLGGTLEETGQIEGAIHHLKKAIQFHPRYDEAYYNLANALKASGQFDTAINAYKKAISIRPDYIQAYNNLGAVYREIGQLIQAIAVYRKALAIKPDYAEAYNNLGNCLKDTGQLDNAVKHFEKAITLKRDYVEAYNNLGVVHKQARQLGKATKAYHKALSINPDYAEALNNLGVVFEEEGETKEAIEYFKKALAAKPEYAAAMRHLAQSVKFASQDDRVTSMKTLFHKDSASDEDKMHLGFGLGKIFSDLKKYEKGFDYILEANRFKRKDLDYNIADDQALFNSIKAVFNAYCFTEYKTAGSTDATPIFIVGMPRSGTSLVEQILSSHSKVFGGGELPDIPEVANQYLMNPARKKENLLANAPLKIFNTAGQEYVRRIRRFSSSALHITDKMPHNFLQVGLIKLILPKAKIIHCMRDPMDTCFSIFKHYFPGPSSPEYAYDMTDLGMFYTLYLDIMDHWRAVLPGFTYDIQYENLVENQETETRRLLEFCALDWEEACLSFHKTKRTVATASSSQVRKPIYKGSVRLWKRYENQLAPLWKAIYGE
ncbi:MAG: tetratricopeptide repeat protein [Desulfobacteraceae bacterium]|nr:tetratricopeptide repeat protein [Desulfobacteraceae bacterium]